VHFAIFAPKHQYLKEIAKKRIVEALHHGKSARNSKKSPEVIPTSTAATWSHRQAEEIPWLLQQLSPP